MYDRHSVDEKHDVTPSVAGKRVGRVKHGLFGNLIAAAATCDLLSVIELQRHFLAEMSLVIGIITFDRDGFAVDEGVQLYRSTAGIDLFDYLVHLSSGERVVAKTIDSTVVVIKYVGPVFYQIGFRLVF